VGHGGEPNPGEHGEKGLETKKWEGKKEDIGSSKNLTIASEGNHLGERTIAHKFIGGRAGLR